MPKASSRWRNHPQGAQAARIGTLVSGGCVTLATTLGGQRFIGELSEDPLPRIC
ncbi:hypothetical protein [Uliginosibacterium flavum]|uniref:Uncharacterized protein n=1 Tax=Uliginosibacterium flavum TaxID=1396831 RepID=A0ABV2TN91_9RHOO